MLSRIARRVSVARARSHGKRRLMLLSYCCCFCAVIVLLLLVLPCLLTLWGLTDHMVNVRVADGSIVYRGGSRQ